MAKKETPAQEKPIEEVKKEVIDNYSGGHDYISRIHKSETDGKKEEKPGEENA